MQVPQGIPIPEADPGLGLLEDPDVWGRHAWAVGACLAWTRPGDAALDIGCGQGDVLALYLRAGRRPFGIDVHPDQVRTTQERHPGAEARLYDGSRLPFPDGSFRYVSMLEVLEHVADEAAMLAEIRRVLVPGGVVALTTPHAGRWQFLDPDNFKFRAPRLHRAGYALLGRGADHERRFGGLRGLFGNFTERSDGKPLWHRHYRVEEVLGFASGFTPLALRREGGLLFSLALVCAYACEKLTGTWPRPLRTAMRWGTRRDLGEAGYALHLALRRD